jgi:hypothetical protein
MLRPANYPNWKYQALQLMQDCNILVSSLRERGVRLWSQNGRLHFSAPQGTLSSIDLQQLRTHKSQVIELLEQAELLHGVPTGPRSSTDPMDLTALQTQKWHYVQDLRGGRSERTCVISQHIVGPLDAAALRAAMLTVLHRHEALRTRFKLIDGVPKQWTDTNITFELQQIDLEHQDIDAMNLCERFVAAGVELSEGPLVAAKLMRIAADRHIFMVVTDHMVSDAVSCAILAEEIWTSYDRGLRNLPSELSPPAFQYLDYVAWQHRTHEAWLAAHGRYWQERFRGIPASPLAFHDRVRPPVCKFHPLTFDTELTAGLRNLAKTERNLLALVVLTICAVAISRMLGQRDYALAFVSSCRDKPELQRLVGFLADYLHLRVGIDESLSFTALLQSMTQEFRAAFNHQDYGRAPALVPECKAEIVFNWVPQATPPDFPTTSPLQIEPIRVPIALPLPVPMKLCPGFEETATRIVGALAYRPDVFSETQMRQLEQRLLKLAADVSSRPRDRLATLGID